MDNDRHKIWHSDRSPLEEQFCVFKIFEMSAIFKMAVKTRHKKWVVKIQHCPISSKFDMWVDNDVPTLKNFYRSPFSKWLPQYHKYGDCKINFMITTPTWQQMCRCSVKILWHWHLSLTAPFFVKMHKLLMVLDFPDHCLVTDK